MIGDTKKPFRNYIEFSEYGTSTSATHATKVVLSPGSAIAELAFQSEVEIVVIRLLQGLPDPDKRGIMYDPDMQA